MTKLFNNTTFAAAVTKRTKIFDSGAQGVTGLYIDINAAGTRRRFWLKVQAETGKQVSVPVGEFSATFGRDEARREANKLRGNVVTTIVDVHIAKTAADALTFEEVADRYVAFLQQPVRKADGVHRARKESFRNDVGFLKRARDAFGALPITQVTEDHIATLLDGITAEGKAPLSNQVRVTLFSLFKWSTQAGRKFVPFNVCTKLGKRNEVFHKDRKLSDAEIAQLVALLDSADCPVDRRHALALKLVLVTALRPGEVVQTVRGDLHNFDGFAADVDCDDIPLVRIPLHRVKKRRVILQPLNALALEIVRELISLGDDSKLFVAGRGCGNAVTIRTLAKAVCVICAKLGWTSERKFTPHDLRRTAASLLGRDKDEAKQVAQSEVSRVLDHIEGNATTAIYQREHTVRRAATLSRLDALVRACIGRDAQPAGGLATSLQALLAQGLDEVTLAARIAALVAAPAADNVVPLRRVA